MRWFIAFLTLWPGLAASDCIVLLHGLGRSDASMLVMEHVLSRRGHEVVNHGYPSTDQNIETLAANVVPQATRRCAATPFIS